MEKNKTKQDESKDSEWMREMNSLTFLIIMISRDHQILIDKSQFQVQFNPVKKENKTFPDEA